MNNILDTKLLKPKVMPFKCPNCGGYGTVGYVKKICHSCKGKGYVLVEQEIKNEELV